MFKIIAAILIGFFPSVVEAQVSRKTVDDHIELISTAVKQRGFSANLLRALIHVESKGNPEAVREEPKIGTRSIGLTQVLVTTAAGFGVKGRELKDPETSVWVGGLYLRDCLKFEGGSEEFGLACYNAGPRKKRRYPGEALCYAKEVRRVKSKIERGQDVRGRDVEGGSYKKCVEGIRAGGGVRGRYNGSGRAVVRNNRYGYSEPLRVAEEKRTSRRHVSRG